MQILKKAFLFFFLILSATVALLGWDGDLYLKNSELQVKWGKKYLPKLQLQGHERILDVGCGDGRVSAYLAAAVPEGSVVGIDNSDSMLKVAKGINSLANLSFMEMDAAHITFEQEFDLVVSFSCLHWVKDQLGALCGIAKSLKKGGRAFLYFAPDHGRERFDHAIDEVRESPTWKRYFKQYNNPFHLITPSDLCVHVKNAQLLVKRIEIITVDEVFPSKTAFKDWIRGWMSLNELPEEGRNGFLDDILARYFQMHPPDEQGFHYIDYWMEVELVK